MNKVMIVGRIVRDPDVRYSTGEKATAVARFSVAVNRRFKNAEGGYDADFPNCIAFGAQAEFVSKYFHKGDMIGLDGRLTTGNYTNKDGQKVYTTDVTVENVEFVGGKSNGSSDGKGGTSSMVKPTKARGNDNSWADVPADIEDEELPF